MAIKPKPFWDQKYGKNAICAITLTRLRPGKNKKGKSYVIKLNKCKHFFYRSAFEKWKENNNTCPICRTKF